MFFQSLSVGTWSGQKMSTSSLQLCYLYFCTSTLRLPSNLITFVSMAVAHWSLNKWSFCQIKTSVFLGVFNNEFFGRSFFKKSEFSPTMTVSPAHATGNKLLLYDIRCEEQLHVWTKLQNSPEMSTTTSRLLDSPCPPPINSQVLAVRPGVRYNG